MTPEELERILLASDPERLKALAHQYGLCRVNLMWWIRKSVTDPVSCVVHQIKRSTKRVELSDALRVAIPIVDEWRSIKLPEPRPAPPRVKLVIPVETVCHSRAPLVERIRAPMLQTQSELLIKRAKCAPQLYTLADLARIFKLPPRRLRDLERMGEFPRADVIIPGAGHKAQRWSATLINKTLERWASPLASGAVGAR